MTGCGFVPWQHTLTTEQWPHMRLMRVLFATKKGHKYETWLFKNAEDLFRQEVFWTQKFDTMRRHNDNTKGNMPVIWHETTHQIIWC